MFEKINIPDCIVIIGLVQTPTSEEKGPLTPITTPLILGMPAIIRLIFTSTAGCGSSTKAPTAAKPDLPCWLVLSKQDKAGMVW